MKIFLLSIELNMIESIKTQLQKLQQAEKTTQLSFRKGRSLYYSGQVQLLTQSSQNFDFSVDDAYNDFELSIINEEDELSAKCSCKAQGWCHHAIACAFQLIEELERTDPQNQATGKKYTRQGMVKRVLEERRLKAAAADYKIEFADNIYGEHLLYNEKGKIYKLTLRNFDTQHGYCACKDFANNKLGTCKHLMFAFNTFKNKKNSLKNASREFPFVEIYLDPLNDYKISWYYPHTPEPEIQQFLSRFFGDKKASDHQNTRSFLEFIDQAIAFKQILIRPEVLAKIERAFNELTLKKIEETTTLDFSLIKANLYPYQKKGVQFASFKDSVIIADEMGLGKTLQAISIALMKKKIFGFQKTLIICPASIKAQWKAEIEKFTDEKAIIVEGMPEERAKMYKTPDPFFFILNYETVLRDYQIINKLSFDFIILDEAQRIKNFNTITANAIKSLDKKHALVITGTPIENQLTDLYSIVQFLDPKLLSPLWEFSYQHCYFDEKQKNKITGYYNLQNLKNRLQNILLRREKQHVLKDLPNLSEHNIPIEMSLEQASYHANFAKGIAAILRKKYTSPYDIQRMMLLLSRMRMVCDSTHLIDEESNSSPKLQELQHILTEKLDIKNSNRKVIIFSEWIRMNALIGKMLRKNNISFTELSGKVPVSKRKKLIEIFFDDPTCNVFLSTEAGGTGLNLQIADTIINFELPWNPAKKNQRIGRIDRLGQKNKNLTVINFITKNSIEEKIASGLVLKQNLFEGVLNKGNTLDYVDFSSKGRSQFLEQLETIIDDISTPVPVPVDEPALEITEEILGVTDTDEIIAPSNASTNQKEVSVPNHPPQPVQARQMQEVLNQGMGFLSSLMKMATGQDLELSNQAIEVNQDTGEVIMRFKLPKRE